MTTAPASRKSKTPAASKAASKAAAGPAAPSPTRKVAGATKPAAQPAAKVAAQTPAPKPAKIKLVRDSFTMPSDEYAALAQLKQRALAFAHPAKKSELLRAGIKLLAGLNEAALQRALKNVPAIKTGRPKSRKSA